MRPELAAENGTPVHICFCRGKPPSAWNEAKILPGPICRWEEIIVQAAGMKSEYLILQDADQNKEAYVYVFRNIGFHIISRYLFC